MTINMGNYQGYVMLVQCLIVDSNNTPSSAARSPMRMIYVWGAGLNTTVVTSNYQAGPNDQVIIADCSVSNANITVTACPLANIRSRRVIVRKAKWDTTSYTVSVVGHGSDLLQ